ncbi:MAG: metallophosphoesterase [Clostridia bacterium]|nr:metallophosphoesterase [Clostridia bacterium]
MKKRKYIFSIVLFLVCILAFAFDVRLKTVTYNVKSPKIDSKIKLSLVTDLHSCYYGKNQKKLLNKIEKYQPDVVLLGGDIFDDVLDDNNAKVFVDALAQKYKTYYVSGNHEWWSKRMDNMFDYLTYKGIVVLRGNTDVIKIGENKISVSGIDDPEVNVYDSAYPAWEKQLEEVGEKAEEDIFNLLLSHRTENAEKYFQYDFDAVLSGHAHGGQFGIPFILNGLYAPNQGFFPKLAGGMYDFDGRKLIVSRGLSRESTRIPRIFNRPELVFVNIMHS